MPPIDKFQNLIRTGLKEVFLPQKSSRQSLEVSETGLRNSSKDLQVFRLSPEERTKYPWLMQFPGSDINYQQQVGDPLLNSALAAVLNWVCRTFPEAPLQEYKRDSHGTYHPVEDAPIELLIANPNKYYDGTTLWMGTLLSWYLSGNAYWLKRRDGRGKVVELYYVPESMIEPRWPFDGSEWLSHYDFFPLGGTNPWKLEPSEVVHFRNGIDTQNNRKGTSMLKSILREVFSDNEATNFSSALLRNMGVPGVIISPTGDDTDIDEETAAALKEGFKKKFTGDSRGEPLVMTSSIKIQPVSLNPQELDLKLLHRLPEERIAAVFGVPAIVAGLGVGLEHGTMSNFKEAREMAYETTIIPLQQILVRQLERQLLPDFEKNLKGLKLQFNLSDVRVLQDDENAKFTRYDIGVRGGWIKVAEARTAANLPVDEADNIYLNQKPAQAPGGPQLPGEANPNGNNPALMTAGHPGKKPNGQMMPQKPNAAQDAQAADRSQRQNPATKDMVTTEFYLNLAPDAKGWIDLEQIEADDIKVSADYIDAYLPYHGLSTFSAAQIEEQMQEEFSEAKSYLVEAFASADEHKRAEALLNWVLVMAGLVKTAHIAAATSNGTTFSVENLKTLEPVIGLELAKIEQTALSVAKGDLTPSAIHYKTSVDYTFKRFNA